MLNKKDPLIDAIQQVMQSNQADRDAVKAVNEKFGIQDRKVLPRERQGEWDAAYQAILSEGTDPSKYSEKQRELASTAGNKKVIDGPDLRDVRKHGGKHIGEGNVDTIGKGENEGGSAVTYAKMPITNAKKSMGDLRKGDAETGMGRSENLAHQGNSVVTKTGKNSSSVTPSTMKEGAKVDRMEKHIEDSEKKSGKSSKQAKEIAWKTLNKRGMLNNKNKKVNEGFNDRHNLSVNASADKQVVADQLNEKVGNPLLLKKANAAMKPKVRIGDTGIRRTISGTNDVQTRLANLRRSPQPLDPNRNVALDQPQTQSNMARADATIASKVQSKTLTVPTSTSAKDPKSSNALSARMRQTAGQRQGAPARASAPSNTTSIADKPKMTQASTTTQPNYDKMSFKQAFSSARKQAGGAGGKFKYKDKEYQTNIKGTGTSSKPQEKYQASNKFKSVAPAPQTQTKTSVTGGQGIAGIASNSINKPVARPVSPNVSMSGGGVNNPKIDAKAQGAQVSSSGLAKPSGSTAQPYGMNIPAKLNPDSRIAQGDVTPTVDAKAQGVQLPPRTTQGGGGRNDGPLSPLSSTSGTSTAFGGPKIEKEKPINNVGKPTNNLGNKQLAEMIKTLRKEKMLEQMPGGLPKFKGGAGDVQDYSGPNRVINKASKEQHHIKEIIGPTHAGSLQNRTGNIDKTPAGRAKFQGGNQDRNPQSYTSEENKKEVELGTTDTGQTGETVSVNPTDTTASATGSMNKNTTTKEIKEKKNATMG